MKKDINAKKASVSKIIKAHLARKQEPRSISIGEVNYWGDHVCGHDPKNSSSYYAVQLQPNDKVTGEDGEVIATATRKYNIALFDPKTGKCSMGKKEDFIIFDFSPLPTVAEVDAYKAREANLSKADRYALDAYVARQYDYDTRSTLSPKLFRERRENLFKSLIKDADFLAATLKAEKEYQSMSPNQKRLHDQQSIARRDQDFERFLRVQRDKRVK
ncbi:MAG: hypothetical protein ILP11_03835 [Alphaproteobacteria bacterium]|nr:hypothetical protein [Alphaproteobacteria bacterium]